jgi:HSP20 family molecular chaperone IbpA
LNILIILLYILYSKMDCNSTDLEKNADYTLKLIVHNKNINIKLKYLKYNLESYDNEGKLHRDDDLPALIEKDEHSFVEAWYKHGVLHRDGDMYAVNDQNYEKRWYKHGLLHRDGDLPAIEDIDENKAWYKHGVLHRDGDLPAFIGKNGTMKWYINGEVQKIVYGKD